MSRGIMNWGTTTFKAEFDGIDFGSGPICVTDIAGPFASPGTVCGVIVTTNKVYLIKGGINILFDSGR